MTTNVVLKVKIITALPLFRCELEIKSRVRSLENILLECQERLLAELDKIVREMAEEPNVGELRDISFQPSDLTPFNNILGFLAVDGFLPSHLNLLLSSPLTELRPGSSVLFCLEADTEVTLKPGWDQKIKIQVSFTDIAGEEKLIRMKKKIEGRKRLLKFDTREAGIYKVTATLYDSHITNSPFLVPVSPDLLKTIGLDYGGLEDSQVTPGRSAAVKEEALTPSVSSPASPSISSSPSTLVSNNTSNTSTAKEEKEEQETKVDARGDADPFPDGSKVRFCHDRLQHEGVVLRKQNPRLYIVKKRNGGFVGLRPEEMTVDVAGRSIGQQCIALWTEDSVHYNAKIVESLPDGNYRVLFVDYGNEEVVSPDHIFTKPEEIPDGGFIDEFVRQTEPARQSEEEQDDVALTKEETEFDSDDWGGSSDPVFFTAPQPSNGIAQSGSLEFPTLLSGELKSVGMIDVGVPVSSMALLGQGREILLCVTHHPRQVQLFHSLSGTRLGSLEHQFLLFPEAILVRNEGGVVISDCNTGGVHLFDSNLDYVEFLPIPDSATITSLTEGRDATIISLNQSDTEGVYTLTTALFGNSSERLELNDLVDMAQYDRNPNGAQSLPRSDCRFITTKLDKTYIIGKFHLG